MRNKKIAILFITFFVLAFTGFIILQKVFSLSDTGGPGKHENVTTRDNTTEATEEPTTEVPTTEEESTEADGPVNLFNCYTTINDWDNYVGIEYNTMDNMGDEHNKSYTFDDYDNSDSNSSITVKLDRKYTRLVIPSMYLLEESKDSDTEYILVFKDYDTGNEIGASPMITKGSKATSFEIDVTGVEFLEISKRITSYSVWHDCVVGMDGAYLYTD